jgi:hypothetical protein
MRALTVSERRLGLILLGLVLVIANLFLGRMLVKQQRAWQRDIARLQVERREAATWLAEQDLWSQRKAWLDEKLPRSNHDGQDPARLLELLQQSAGRHKIVIIQQKLQEPLTLERYREVAIQLEVKGTLEAIGRWLAELQAPDKFQAITKLTMQNAEDAAQLKCQLTVAWWLGN